MRLPAAYPNGFLDWIGADLPVPGCTPAAWKIALAH